MMELETITAEDLLHDIYQAEAELRGSSKSIRCSLTPSTSYTSRAISGMKTLLKSGSTSNGRVGGRSIKTAVGVISEPSNVS
jgi:hypothetical protein